MGPETMVDDRSSPSAGWREVYAEMEVDTSIEDDGRPCPDCGRRSPRIFRTVYHCERHGYWRTDGPNREEEGEDERDETGERERAEA